MKYEYGPPQPNSVGLDVGPRSSGAAKSGATRVVIVGAGFAGLEVAKALETTAARITVLDRHNYTLFQPLLYQVATAALSPADVAVPIRSLLRRANVDMLLEEAEGVEFESSCVRTRSGRRLQYDFLVLATGSRFNYFGHENWAALAPSPKSLADAIEIRRRLLLAFERAEMCEDGEERQAFMTFVVVGGGPTGVEMAGAIAELAKATLRRDFRRIDPAAARIVLVEAGPRVLGNFADKLGKYAHKTLTRMGVQVLLDTKVDEIDETGIRAGGRRIEARTVVWGAGVKAGIVAKWLGVKPGPHGTVKVKEDFSVPSHPNIFVIGDAAEATGSDGKPLPGLAAVAKQEGQYVGDLLRARVSGDERSRSFRYRDYGTMATIGRSAAVADLRGFQLTGTVAWLLWGLVHLAFLIGFRNRLAVLINWFWAWLTYAHGARLITEPPIREARSRRSAKSQSAPPILPPNEMRGMSSNSSH
ncbi:MAG TPA: NAD(P)/FAD-dependent oxidoreductase [Nitrospiraceae bacterium]|nr:NAD(P)/FAD-dependent oxidoreductase [Nitrospiraceae bacterium]